jgi:hypothetical protein
MVVNRVSWNIALAIVAFVAGCHGSSECVRNLDCNSGTGKACAYRQVWCEKGVCQAQCPQLCKTDVSNVNSCGGDLICTDDGQQMPTGPFCSALAITCTDATQCPLYRPLDDAGAQWQWSCVNGICQYPGLQYVHGEL